MAKACDRPRCPARADVDDAVTTEYRKGCRRTACTEANRLATQRRRAAKVAVPAPAPTPKPAEPVEIAEDRLDSAENRFDIDEVAVAIRADLAELQPEHPLARTLAAVALTLAHQVDLGRYGVMPSAPGAARQLLAVLEQLVPAKSDGPDLDEQLRQLLEEEDDDDADRYAAG